MEEGKSIVNRHLTPKRAAEIAGCSQAAIYKAAENHNLTVLRDGRRLWITLADLIMWMNTRGT